MASEDRPPIESGSIYNVPYLAKVVGHLDPKYMGALEVQLMKQVGNTPKADGQVYQVKYASPFLGQTSHDFNSEDNDYNGTQKSYGMWMIPPDIGSMVIVVFIEGDSKQGYYIGCVQDLDMNFMVPGYAATSYVVDGEEEREPVAEYNKTAEQTILKDTTKIPKPTHKYQTETLKKQGLLNDDTRGITTSSARREIPSMVFGISTPGPIDKEGPSGKIGKLKHEASGFSHSRLGGSSFVMDDGDDKYERKKPAGGDECGPPEYINLESEDGEGMKKIPHNELIRIRTRTGHQILLHNSEDLIYIGNARGTAWIELTSDGKIDIFSQDSINIRTKKDFNFYCDRDFNLEVGRNFNTVIKGEMHTTVGKDQILIIERDQKIHIKKRKDETIDEEFRQTVNDDVKLFTAKDYTLNVDGRFDFRVAKGCAITTGAGASGAKFAPSEATSQDGNDPVGNDQETSKPVEDVNGPNSDRTDVLIMNDLRVTKNKNHDMQVLGKASLTVIGDYNINVTGKILTTSGGSNETKAGGNIIEKAPKIHMNGPDAASAINALFAFDVSPGGAKGARKTAKATLPLTLKKHKLPDLEEQNKWEELKELETILRRVPTPEPYPHHEHLDPIKFKAEKEGESPGLDRDSEERYMPADDQTPTETLAEPPEYWRKYTTVTDTFSKISAGDTDE